MTIHKYYYCTILYHYRLHQSWYLFRLEFKETSIDFFQISEFMIHCCTWVKNRPSMRAFATSSCHVLSISMDHISLVHDGCSMVTPGSQSASHWEDIRFTITKSECVVSAHQLAFTRARARAHCENAEPDIHSFLYLSNHIIMVRVMEDLENTMCEEGIHPSQVTMQTPGGNLSYQSTYWHVGENLGIQRKCREGQETWKYIYMHHHHHHHHPLETI